MANQVPFGFDVETANNPEPRLPCVLLLDGSKSMQGPPLAALSEGVQAYRADLAKDSLAAMRVEVAVITFGGAVQVNTAFVGASHFQPPPLSAQGKTPMGEAILRAIDLIAERKTFYRRHGLKRMATRKHA
jgi:uncharacterized protein YegL